MTNPALRKNFEAAILGLFLSAALLLLAASAGADTIVGTVHSDAKGVVRLNVEAPDEALVLAIEGRSQLLGYMRSMRNGDLVVGQGRIDIEKKKVMLDSVDRVGLQDLLGAWRSSRREIFEFKDYNELNLYVPTVNEGEKKISLELTHSLKYVVTPDRENRFSIFMSDNRNVRMGFMEVSPKKITLTVTDFRTGQVTENISLSPLRMQSR